MFATEGGDFNLGIIDTEKRSDTSPITKSFIEELRILWPVKNAGNTGKIVLKRVRTDQCFPCPQSVADNGGLAVLVNRNDLACRDFQ
jgi:hypothetical protein